MSDLMDSCITFNIGIISTMTAESGPEMGYPGPDLEHVYYAKTEW